MASLLACAIFGALQIVGPSQVEAGDLAVFRFEPGDTPVVWSVIPEAAKERFLEVLLPDGKRALVFSSGRPMQVVIVAAGYVGGQVYLAFHSFINGSHSPTPPNPGPGPPPNPDDPKPPRPTPPFILLWIEETTERTAAQAQAQNDSAIRQALQRAGWQLRVVDKDIKNERGETPADLASWIERAVKLGLPRLFVIDKAGRHLSYPAPKDRGEFVKILAELGLVIQQAQQLPSSHPTTSRYAIPHDDFMKILMDLGTRIEPPPPSPSTRPTTPRYVTPRVTPSCVGPFCVP